MAKYQSEVEVAFIGKAMTAQAATAAVRDIERVPAAAKRASDQMERDLEAAAMRARAKQATAAASGESMHAARRGPGPAELSGPALATAKGMQLPEWAAITAKVAITVQAVQAGAGAITAATRLIKGDMEGAAHAIERLPLGIGGAVTAVKTMYGELSGVSDIMEKVRKDNERMDAVAARRAKRSLEAAAERGQAMDFIHDTVHQNRIESMPQGTARDVAELELAQFKAIQAAKAQFNAPENVALEKQAIQAVEALYSTRIKAAREEGIKRIDGALDSFFGGIEDAVVEEGKRATEKAARDQERADAAMQRSKEEATRAAERESERRTREVVEDRRASTRGFTIESARFIGQEQRTGQDAPFKTLATKATEQAKMMVESVKLLRELVLLQRQGQGQKVVV